MNEKLKVLVVLVNYGDEQLNYLEQVVGNLRNFKKYKVRIIVNSNIELNIDGIDETKIFTLENYQLLPLTCRTTIWENRNDYDIFIYGENDHLFKEYHIDNHLEYTKLLPNDRLSGLIQYEKNNRGVFYPGYHIDFDWEYDTVEVYGGRYFAHFKNLHQASFILTRNQLKKVGTNLNFKELKISTPLNVFQRALRKLLFYSGRKVERLNKYSVKCKVNTDVFEFGGMKKLICISEFEENLIHHLPNLYIDGSKAVSYTHLTLPTICSV